MKILIKPSFYVDRLPLHFRMAIEDTHWETMMPPEDATYVDPDTPLSPAGTYWTTHLRLNDRFRQFGPLPERIDTDFEISRPGSVFEAGLEALELARIQLVRWGIPGLVSKFCLAVDDVMLRDVRLTFRMQANDSRSRWEVMHLSDIEDKLPCDETATVIYANASFEQSRWPLAAPSADQLASIPDVLLIEARLGESFLKSYDLDALANWEAIDLPAMCGSLFDTIVLGTLDIEAE